MARERHRPVAGRLHALRRAALPLAIGATARARVASCTTSPPRRLDRTAEHVGSLPAFTPGRGFQPRRFLPDRRVPRSRHSRGDHPAPPTAPRRSRQPRPRPHRQRRDRAAPPGRSRSSDPLMTQLPRRRRSHEPVGRMRGAARARSPAARGDARQRRGALPRDDEFADDEPSSSTSYGDDEVGPSGSTSSSSSSKSMTELAAIADELAVENAAGMRKQDLIFAILKAQTANHGRIYAEGVLETLPDGFGFLRAPDQNYLAGPRRHLRVAVADPPLQPAHRRHRARPDPPAEGGRALLRAAQGRPDQLRAARGGAAQDPVRQPDAALPAGEVRRSRRSRAGSRRASST